MIRSDKYIAQWVVGDPDDPDLNPASLDMRITGHMIRRYQDPENKMGVIEQEWKDLEEGQQILLEPGSQWLLATEKVFFGPQDAGLFTLKSSLARRGLFLSNPGWIDPGYEGAITFSVTCCVPIVLTVGEKIGQIIYMAVDEIPRRLYAETGRYQDSEGPTKEKVDAPKEETGDFSG
jgi:dCTP deaminase